jgi:hypothetical protein
MQLQPTITREMAEANLSSILYSDIHTCVFMWVLMCDGNETTAVKNGDGRNAVHQSGHRIQNEGS